MNLYITLDYELFLGEKTGTPENCLIKPMNELCKVAEKHNFKFVIFVDATYLLRMCQLKSKFIGVERQYILVCDHVKSMAKQGHDIQLHFHPQWLYSEWDENACQWKMDREHYKLSDLPIKEAISSLREAKNLLDEIIGYKTKAFRAGGFCLDSFYEYKVIFKELGIKIDSSVARKTRISSPIHSYDYRNIPQEQIYNFNNSIKCMDEQGEFVELSISSFKWSALSYYLRIRPQRECKQAKLSYKDGRGISDGKQSFIGKILNMLRSKYYLASIDGNWSNILEIYMNESEKKGLKELILIGHPKNASDLSIANLSDFIEKNKENITIKTTQII